jgi:hypothetical protein
VLPARDPNADEGDVAIQASEASGEKSKTGIGANPAPQSEVKIASQDVTVQPGVTTQQDVTVQQDATMKSGETVDGSMAPRALHERKISEIAPYYDRERDSDIRKFALDKGREMDIEFKPKPFIERDFPEVVLAWEVSNYTYRPLYFSDPALERYGHAHHPLIQPFASIARVGVQFVMLPYQMTISPVNKDESVLGWYRPGDVAPKLHYQVPLNAEAALVEAGAVTGLYFFIVP